MSSIIYDSAPLEERIHRSLSDTFKHRAIETAQDVITGKRDALVAEVDNWEDFRDHAAAIRDHVLANLDYYVREFATNAEKNGAHVYFAPTDTDALECILDIFEDLGATSCVKSKSMMTEEIGLNKFLEKHGISAIETDCAEHIIQTAGNAPSHIVVPALHFDRTSIRDLYHERKGYEGTNDPEEITRFLRKILRPEFMNASVGVTGCNFGVAETGSCTLVSNEGNARMTSSIPETQIIVMGTERIVPDLRSLDVFMKLLVRSAVGAKISGSFSVNTGPRREGEADGPKNVHIVIVNNGRTNILGSEFRPMLRCIRCGACMNSCPVYRHITGHGYGSIYPGPMGIVLTPLLVGYKETAKLPYACSLCGSCADVCPVKIPLPALIAQHRRNIVSMGYVSPAEKAVFTAAAATFSSRALYGMATSVAPSIMKVLTGNTNQIDKSTTFIPVLNGWTASRNLDPMNKQKFRSWFAQHKKQEAEAKRAKTAQEISAAASRIHSALGQNPTDRKSVPTNGTSNDGSNGASLPTASVRKED